MIGMLGVVLLGVCAEGVSRLRHELSNKARGAHADEHFKYTLLQTGLHGLHALTGYILMLATMTFSCEMMLSVIVGLMIGYYVFGQATVISSSPCCAFLEDECDVCEPLRDPTQPRNDTGLPLEVGSCRVEINTSTPDNVIVEESTTSEGMP